MNLYLQSVANMFHSHPLSGRGRPVESRPWTEQESGVLMMVYSQLYQKHSGIVHWQMCYEILVSRGLQRSRKDCVVKVKNLRRAFMKVYCSKDGEKRRRYSESCLYWEIMCKVWGAQFQPLRIDIC
jgi:Myb/SANT-like DNA-binding domain